MQIRKVQKLLNENGFPCGAVDGKTGPRTSAAIARFQAAFAGIAGAASALHPTGRLDEGTEAALECLPYLSPNFLTSSFRQHDGGPCYVQASLVLAAEILRAELGEPLPIISGYRDPAYNASVGGAPHSIHTFGLAMDISRSHGLTVAHAKKLHIFSGMGSLRTTADTSIVVHLDLRHLPPRNHPTATPARPAQWFYPR